MAFLYRCNIVCSDFFEDHSRLALVTGVLSSWISWPMASILEYGTGCGDLSGAAGFEFVMPFHRLSR